MPLLLRLLFFTAVRVGELVKIEVDDVDLAACKIFVDQGKGSKDRYLLFQNLNKPCFLLDFESFPALKVQHIEKRASDCRTLQAQHKASLDFQFVRNALPDGMDTGSLKP